MEGEYMGLNITVLSEVEHNPAKEKECAKAILSIIKTALNQKDRESN
jgi:hypothetical protein